MSNRTMITIVSAIILALIAFGALTSPRTQEVTLRELLSSNPTPLISSYEVVDEIADGRYHLVDVALNGNDQGVFILDGDYEVGDVITIMYSDMSMEEVTGEIKVGTAKELDK